MSPKNIVADEFAGKGGSYTVDPATGEKTLADRTAPALTAQEERDAADLAASAEADATRVSQGRRGRAEPVAPAASAAVE